MLAWLILASLATTRAYVMRVGSAPPHCQRPANMTCAHVFMPASDDCFYDMNGMCEMQGGRCMMEWQDRCNCDYKIPYMCGEGTGSQCCVVCGEDTQSTCAKYGGSCKSMCGRFDYVKTDTPCKHKDCKCCAECRSTPVGGCEAHGDGSRCVGHESLCGPGYYIEYGSCENGCVCCRPATVSRACRDVGGYPEKKGEVQCKDGYVKDAKLGSEVSTCCRPAQLEGRSVASCRPAPDAARHTHFCIHGECPIHHFQYDIGVSTDTDHTCKCCTAGGWQRCRTTQECRAAGGYASSQPCRCGYVSVPSAATSLDDVPCHCCVHQACAPLFSGLQ